MENTTVPQKIPKKPLDFKVLFAIVGILSLIGYSLVVVLFLKNNSLGKSLLLTSADLEKVKTENNQLEKDLIFYKNTDLAKELEIVNLKLKNSEDTLAETKNSLSNTEKSLNDLRSKIEDIPQIVNILSLMYGTASKQPPQCYSEADKSNINKELNVVGDTSWSQLWNEFISNTTSSNCSNSPELLQKALDHGYQKILDIVE